MRTSYVTLPLLVGLSIGMSGPAAKYKSLDANGHPFKATFNADVGKVRVVMLVAPT